MKRKRKGKLGRPAGERKVITTIYLKERARMLAHAQGINIGELVSDVIMNIYADPKEMELSQVRQRLVALETETAQLRVKESTILDALRKKDKIMLEYKVEKLCDAWRLRNLLREGKGLTGARGLLGGWDIKMGESEYADMAESLRDGTLSVNSPIEDFAQFHPLIRSFRLRAEAKEQFRLELETEGQFQTEVQQ